MVPLDARVLGACRLLSEPVETKLNAYFAFSLYPIFELTTPSVTVKAHSQDYTARRWGAEAATPTSRVSVGCTEP